MTVNRTLPRVAPPRAAIAFTPSPTDQEIFQARVFTEPFVPTGPTAAAENRALSDAIAAYATGPDTDDIRAFEAFARTHPSSAWRASVLANAGVVYRRTGRITKALDVFTEAWTLTAGSSTPGAAAVGQFAMGESLDMLATLGQAHLMTKQLALLGNRQLTGPAAAKARPARFTLSQVDGGIERGRSSNRGPLVPARWTGQRSAVRQLRERWRGRRRSRWKWRLWTP